MKRKGVGRILALLIPLVLGLAGFFCLDGRPFLDSLFTCIQLYVLGYSDPPPNLCVELARWLAPLATVSGVFLAAGALRRAAGVWLRYLRGNSVAVYGPQEERAIFLEQLGKRGIEGQEELVPARRYILAGEEEENFRFYRTHRKALEGREVFLKCRSIPARRAEGKGLKLFCPENTASRLFWKGRGMYAISKANDHQMSIVMLGFGRLGEELLIRGLQDNLFDPQQKITYHIFGEGREFQAVHTSLSSISDPVLFHEEPWYDCPELLEEAALVLVLPQPDQLARVQALLRLSRRETVDVFASEAFPFDLLAERERLRLFLWEREACQLKTVFSDELLELSKRINLRYWHRSSGAEETQEEKERQWLALDGFLRYSNISAADYHEIRMQMLKEMGLPAKWESLSFQQAELLTELEHIRWCRYHFLNNWRFGRPENGKRKDAVNRVHVDLVPYEALTEEEKELDRENIRCLLSVALSE